MSGCAVNRLPGMYQPASITTYSSLFFAAKSMKYLNVSVFMPTRKSTPRTSRALHQSHAALPGLIQETSASRDGAASV